MNRKMTASINQVLDPVVIVDENDQQLQIVTRKQAHVEGLLHRIVVVFLIRSNGKEILVLERLSGHLDHSCAGHVNPGELYEQAAKRELAEELGVVDTSLFMIGKTITDTPHPEVGQHARHMAAVFISEAVPGRLNSLEVKSVFWAEREAVFADMADNPTHDKYTNSFLTTMRVLRQHYLKS